MGLPIVSRCFQPSAFLPSGSLASDLRHLLLRRLCGLLRGLGRSLLGRLRRSSLRRRLLVFDHGLRSSQTRDRNAVRAAAHVVHAHAVTELHLVRFATMFAGALPGRTPGIRANLAISPTTAWCSASTSLGSSVTTRLLRVAETLFSWTFTIENGLVEQEESATVRQESPRSMPDYGTQKSLRACANEPRGISSRNT